LVTHFQLVPAGDNDEERQANLNKLQDFRFSTEEVSLVDGKHDWPAAMGYVQWVPTGTQVKLAFTRDGKNQSVVVTPYTEDDYHFAGRGLVLDQLNPIHTAKTWGEAFSLGLRETRESLGLVVTFLKKLVTGRIALTSLGGPGTIAVAATSEASRGPAALLIFLTMLSANLAVVNFLPIPVLDGGHMMFLAYEGIFRRPVNEKWQIRLSLLGLSFVLCLMVFVIGLDFYRLSGLAQ
jgi:regulator of sigma E protease